MNEILAWGTRIGVAALAATLLAVTTQSLAQEGAELLPPQVIAVQPYPGEEVLADQPVTLVFDQAMDAASVEAAWQMEPAASLEFTWTDARTLRAIPAGGWQRATRYAVTLGTGAQSADGVALAEPHESFVQTIGRLEVAAVIPAGGAEGVAADATITVSFNRPVVPLVSTGELEGLPDPLQFEPAVEGQGEWINTSIYQFTPAKPLTGGTTYTARVAAGLTDVLGATLDEAYTWQFRTLAPQVLNVSPRSNQSNILLEAPVSIEFSQPMDRASTEAAFALLFGGERVAGKFTWSDDSRRLTFQPDALLRLEASYLITLAPTARGISGEATLKEGLSYAFSTVPAPGIAYTDPTNGARDVYPGGGVSIVFKSPMNTETFADKVEIVSPEGVIWKPVVGGNQSLYLDFTTQQETTYTIRFRRGAQDVYGNTIETDYTFSFVTGVIDPWASLPTYERFMLTSAYRDDTRIAMRVAARPTVRFWLHAIDTSQIGTAMRAYYDDIDRLARRSKLLREWTQTLDAGPTLYGVDEVLLASEQGGKLAPGVYLLRAQGPRSRDPEMMALGVVTANLTVKRGPDEMLIWVTDIQSAEPVAGIAVRLYDGEGRQVGGGETGADGVVRLPVDLYPSRDTFVYAVAEGVDTYGVWMSWGESELPETAGHLYTDRPIYRPGETVYFRGAVRDRQDMTYSVPSARSVYVSIDVNWGGQMLFEGDLPLTEFGTFNGEIALPNDVQLGQANINVQVNGRYAAQVSFTIAEFRVPEYKVAVTPDYDQIVQGDSLKAAVAASYYFGGPVSDAQMSWNAVGQTAWFSYSGPGRYSFSDGTQDYFDWVTLGSGSAITDTNGQVIVSLPDTRAPSRRPMTISIESQVWDESGQVISGRTSVLAHPAAVYVGLRTDRYFGREGQPLNVGLIAVTPDSQPIPAQKIDVKVVEIRWERVPVEGQFGQYTWQRQEIEVESGQVIAADDGTARYTFTPAGAGIYRVQALVRDDYERLNSATLQVWVTGTRPVWWGRPSDSIDLIADKESYQPGDTAEILIPTPFTGTSYALVAVERAGIQAYEVIRIEGSTFVYTLPITEEHLPTIHVSVVLMKGTDAETLNPSYRMGSIALSVEPVSRRLEVTITPSATRAQPGDTVTLDIKATDARGEPISAEVGVTVTDLAILSLMPPNSPTLEEQFYGYQGNYVDTQVALRALLDVLTDELMEDQAMREAVTAPMAAMPTATAEMADGAALGAAEAEGAAPEPVTVRQDFQQTPLWAPRVVTDAAGRASLTLTLPDNLTTWRVDARGLTVDTRVGEAITDVMSTLPLLVRPVTPRFFVVGDRVALAAVINNNTDAAQTVQATLQASGVIFESDAVQTISVEAGARARVEWWVTVEDVKYADLTFIAIGERGYQDAAKPMLATGPDGTIPVYRYTAPDTVGTGGMLREERARTEAISLPPSLDTDQGELTLHLDPSLAVTTVDALDYLKNFPHQCIEQTISRFLPNVMTYRALKDLGLDDPILAANLRAVLDEALARLAREQNPDGGWGWFAQMESNPYITAYAALGLAEARDAGFNVDAQMLDRALNFVRLDLIRPTIDTPVWRLNRQAFYAYVFARAGQAQAADLDTLRDHRLEMDTWALAFLLMAYQEYDPAADAIPALVSDLQSAAILSATGAHWEEAGRDWWNWSSDTRTTAIALAALARVQPDHDLLPNVVRWLMVARQGDHWMTTQETAWAVMALTDWMVASGELRGDYTYSVAINGAGLGAGTVTPETVREGQVLHVAVRDLLRDEINRVTIARSAGEGVLYYTAHLKTRLWASEARPISRGVTVSREYFRADDPSTPVTSAQVGDVITVRVTITLPQEIYYFVLEDPIPAGTEPVDTSLLTTSQLDQPPTIQPLYEPRWYWGWWLFDRSELRDEQLNLYADFLPSGTYVYTYQVRASVPGEFQTMPSHAYAFYFPEVFGRGAGTLFTVTAAAE
ncbi:MAG: Ig-like domain-containing protein [Anaerolineae bacterium]|nr:Ig-like domain-containing protein [Anaerolineae bacterium]